MWCFIVYHQAPFFLSHDRQIGHLAHRSGVTGGWATGNTWQQLEGNWKQTPSYTKWRACTHPNVCHCVGLCEPLPADHGPHCAWPVWCPGPTNQARPLPVNCSMCQVPLGHLHTASSIMTSRGLCAILYNSSTCIFPPLLFILSTLICLQFDLLKFCSFTMIITAGSLVFLLWYYILTVDKPVERVSS